MRSACVVSSAAPKGEYFLEQATDALFGGYLSVLIALFMGFVLIITALLATRLLAPFSTERNKASTYECGMLPIRRSATNVGMRFYLYAILFIIFDVEALFVFPWVLSYVDIGPSAYWTMFAFVATLGAGLAYAWKKGALQWR
jgi:NADH-quinone oxidoreductase subunit A